MVAAVNQAGTAIQKLSELANSMFQSFKTRGVTGGRGGGYAGRRKQLENCSQPPQVGQESQERFFKWDWVSETQEPHS